MTAAASTVLPGLRGLVVMFILALACLPGPGRAVQPDEMLDDPVLEHRAREISTGLRCLVCQNESIDESHASLARDLRLLVRERLMAGDSNEQVVDYIVARYGEFVLLRPTIGGWNWLLWAAGPAMFLMAALLGLFYVRHRSRAAPPESGLNPEEQKRLQDLLNG